MVKRLMDIAVSLSGLVVLSPFLVLTALWVVGDSAGQVFYLQERVGKNGKLFRLYKFRTMRAGADRLAPITVGQRDPRITRAGYFLRKYKLDEIPQLINVLTGDMTLVGPRPELERFVKLYDPQQMQVIAVKPGITDYASIEYRNENQLLEGKSDPVDFYIREIMPAKLKLNLVYIHNQSFWIDLKIIFRTAFMIFR